MIKKCCLVVLYLMVAALAVAAFSLLVLGINDLF